MSNKAPLFRRFLLFLLAAWFLWLAACKQEPDLPDDPHVTLINPFIGVWYAQDEGKYWQFRTDGTGGKADAEAGPFPDDFSFFIYAGQDVRTVPGSGCLVIVGDDDAALYHFTIEGNEAYLKDSMMVTVELKRVSGSPQALNLNNLLIGEWSADWTGGYNGLTWSLKYRADGTVKTFHHQVRHQFENAYVLRKDKLVIFGDLRFGIEPIIAVISTLDNGNLYVEELPLDPMPNGWVRANWTYTKVATAEWL